MKAAPLSLSLIRQELLTAEQLSPRSPADAARGTQGAWSLGTLRGRLTEIQSPSFGQSAALSIAAKLVLQAQIESEPVAWMTTMSSGPFPPDLAACGIDLAALLIIRCPIEKMARSAEELARSGAFGLLLLDLERHSSLHFSTARQARLLALAQKHEIATIFLSHLATDVAAPEPISNRNETRNDGLGSLISLRTLSMRKKIAVGRYLCQLQVLKDKRTAPTWSHDETFDAVPGLR